MAIQGDERMNQRTIHVRISREEKRDNAASCRAGFTDLRDDEGLVRIYFWARYLILQ